MQKIFCAGLFLIVAAVPASAQPRKNQLGPSVTFTNGHSAIGAEGRINLADNVLGVKNSVSLRPFVHFPEGGADFGAAVTYDFSLDRYDQVTPYLGLGVGSINGVTTNNAFGFPLATPNRFREFSFYGQGGVDINVHRDWSLGASFNLPFNNKLGSSFSMGANYRF
jgi:opacity protein-like surface antigen